MHQQPPKTPLLRSTTSAKASQVEASSGRTQYAICSVIDSRIEAARLASGPNSVPLPGITRRDVQEWVNTMAASGLAPATVRHAYRAVFKSVLNDAIDDGLLACSPCYRIELPAAAALPVIEPLTPGADPDPCGPDRTPLPGDGAAGRRMRAALVGGRRPDPGSDPPSRTQVTI